MINKQPDMLYYEEALGMEVYVRKYKRGDLFNSKGADGSYSDYSAWYGGCGIGNRKTLKEAKERAHSYLVQRVRERLDAGLAVVSKAYAWLVLHEHEKGEVTRWPRAKRACSTRKGSASTGPSTPGN